MRRWQKFFFSLVMMVMCSTAMVVRAYAAEQPEISVPITISLQGTLPYPTENYTVALKADNVDYPMPEDASDGTYFLTITGEDTENFPTITYERVGIYTYSVYQVAGTNQQCTYDDTVYSLIVTISNKADYSGLEATAILYPEPNGNKSSGAEFTNKYKVDLPADTSDVVKTGDESSPLLYAVLFMVSTGGIVILFLPHRSKRIGE